MVVDQLWRAAALAEMIAEAGLEAEITRTDEDTPLVRTAVDPRLSAIAARLDPRRGQDGAAALAARARASCGRGRWPPASRRRDRYLLGLDPHAPDTHSPLASALMRVGIAPTLIGTRGARPALRISGRRRLSRLVENVGEPPDDAEALSQWPRV